MITTTPNVYRSTPAQLRRAAGSQSLDQLKEALVGYSVDELDSMQGKNPLHMAAWKGCLENSQHLLSIGCDINAISTGEFSYGKTPICFALTQSRNDVVAYLLERGAKVKVVNNKGQSVLSIAISHLEMKIVDRIVEAELLEEGEWTNYRATHSDGMEYGDLDPRFLDRPLRLEDFITDFCVNPTTKQSRRGSFFRRNNDRIVERRSKPLKERPPRRCTASILTEQETQMLEHAWLAVEDQIFFPDTLVTLVSLSQKLQRPWVRMAADRLRSSGILKSEIEAVFRSVSATSEQHAKLVKRLYLQIQTPTALKGRNGTITCHERSQKLSHLPNSGDGGWKEAYKVVKDLSISAFYEKSLPALCLPHPPIWVDDAASLESLAASLEQEVVIAFDSEWYTAMRGGETSISTVQISTNSNAWVLDLKIDEPEYCRTCQSLMTGLFTSKVMLGFACRRDVDMLSDWCGHTLSYSNCLDLQQLWKDRKTPPGLAACVGEVANKPLSKTEQCSNWARRPLTRSQLEYAGLDATILLYLLAEKFKS
ncbi:hypothetical protein MPSEU_000093800 [Mayamaea pseudoterrestris]|nr:hypothetical protein MPSEU_000093800 [Mayamaea pseudoterrestris]